MVRSYCRTPMSERLLDLYFRYASPVKIGCILHPKCTIISLGGPITLGEGCIVEEAAIILNRSTREPMIIGSCNHFETACRASICSPQYCVTSLAAPLHTGVESPLIGSYNVFEPRARVHSTITIGDNCVIGAGCSVSPASLPTEADWTSVDNPDAAEQPIHDADVEPEEAKEHLEDYTVVYGAQNARRTWSGEGKGQQLALMHKHLAYLTEMLPKYSRLKLIT